MWTLKEMMVCFIILNVTKVLAEIVKLAQNREMKVSKGGWKDFLRSYDKKIGVSLSGPSKRF